jgi:hypothetical protein
MRVVRKRFEVAFHGPSGTRRRRALDTWLAHSAPTIVVGNDRFWFHADIYRLGAVLALHNHRPGVAAGDLVALLQSGQASAYDVELARLCLERTPDPSLGRALARWPQSPADDSR